MAVFPEGLEAPRGRELPDGRGRAAGPRRAGRWRSRRRREVAAPRRGRHVLDAGRAAAADRRHRSASFADEVLEPPARRRASPPRWRHGRNDRPEQPAGAWAPRPSKLVRGRADRGRGWCREGRIRALRARAVQLLNLALGVLARFSPPHVRVDHGLAQGAGFIRHPQAADAQGAQQTVAAEIKLAVRQASHVEGAAGIQERMASSEHQHVHAHARGPHVHGHAVPVAARGHRVLLGRHERGRSALLLQEPARAVHGEAQVRELQLGALGRVGDEEVVRLHVPVANLPGMQERDGR
mmetsp:Transcript_87667/g.252821  ORF Transcript_87667/g.252821 Transcript_87667/m.252821 type:complete len:296 (+) Transcript_87667:455-1342(+)